MPQLPVRCPRCDADLTVGREHLSRPVQCGACGKPFVPVIDPGSREADDAPPRPKKTGGPVFGILSLILGLGGLVTCCCGPTPLVLGAGAVVTGLFGLRSRDARGLAVVGLILGLLSLGLRVLGYAGAFGFGRGGDPFDVF